MLTSILETFGLTPIEAECYETLLPLGAVPMVQLTAAMKRHPQIVYRLVNQLEAKGLVVTETKQHRKYVRAEDPNILERVQMERLEKIREALPALHALKNKPKQAEVHIERGAEATRRLRKRAFEGLPRGGTYYILSPSGEHFYDVVGMEHVERLERLRMKRGVKKKLLAFESQRTFLEPEKRWEGTEIRYMPETFPVPTSTNIFGNTVYIQIWSSETIVIVIESEEVAKSYIDFFETLWKTAKK
jgi:sugar-specific transcriptional regulator TrmB